MKILIDIGHPGHVHFFKNFIWEMQKKGHKFLITAKDKEMTYILLNKYRLDFVPLGKHTKSSFKKLLNIPVNNLKLFFIARKFKPDLFMGLASFRAAQVSWLLGKKSIIFDDTEHSKFEIMLYKPFVSFVLTPSVFMKDLGKKQIRYQGYHELAYMHPNWFKPNPNVLKELNIKNDERYFLLRFVSWEATHDRGYQGLSLETKRKIINKLVKKGTVLISSEKKLEPEFEKYRFSLSPEKMHDVLNYATLYIGEGATTASECCILGTPAIYTNPLNMGYIEEEEKKYGLLFHSLDESFILNKIDELLKYHNLRDNWSKKRAKLLKDKIDVTSYIIEFVKNLKL